MLGRLGLRGMSRALRAPVAVSRTNRMGLNVFQLNEAARPSALATANGIRGFGLLPAQQAVAEDDAVRKKMLWAARNRGWLELDWLVGTFAERYLAALNEKQLALFEEVLQEDNPDLFNYLSGQSTTPENLLNNEVYLMMAEYVNENHPEIMRRMSKKDGGNQNLS